MVDSPEVPNFVELATELTIAWLSNPNTRASVDDVPTFLNAMHAAVGALGESVAAQAPGEAEPEFVPAVTARKSLASKDYIVSMIDGKPYKTLRRHLSRHGMTPEQYRQRYNLKPDYPMVSENYSQARREMAKTIGLGRKPRVAAESEPAAPASAVKRGRKSAGGAKTVSPE